MWCVKGLRTAKKRALTATIAQLVEQLICNQRVAGSIPAGGSDDF